MAFSINDIRSALVGGGARPTLFQVQLTNPVDGIADLKVPFLVQSASIPGMQKGVIPVSYFGRKIKLAGDREFSSWTVTVINDNDFLIRHALEEWSNAINTLEGNIRDFSSSRPSLYKSQAQVVQYEPTGRRIREYQFNGLWPSAIGEIQLDWGADNTIETFQVEFQYDSWELSGGTTGSLDV